MDGSRLAVLALCTRAAPSMPGPFRPVYLDVKGEQSLEQLGLAIKMMLAERAPWNRFAAVNIAGSGMVQSRVSFSGDCHSSAQTDSDQSTTPASAWARTRATRVRRLAALGTHQSCCLSELANNMQRQEVWFIDHLVKSERVGFLR